mmetsp:Transcript_7565/g.13307  ORF Transcript_7565/g.13307 Transcript_7565/m.13307 type:complete len:280 (+) Transcript_7565:2-841(+)
MPPNAVVSSSSSLGLFDTLVPLSSIATVSIVVGYTLPRYEPFGLFLLLWWVLAVFISLNDCLFASQTQWQYQQQSQQQHNNTISDVWGLVVLVGLPMCMWTILLWAWFHGRLRGFLLNMVPLWSMIALHIYRLDGLSIVLPLWKGNVPKLIGFQTIVLDVLMGATAVPLTWMLYTQRTRPFSKRGFKDVLWFWNSLGLYDLCSAYLLLVLNYASVGGSLITEPPFSVLGFHPFPLLILFQVPLAVAIHVLCLTNMDELIEPKSGGVLPLHVRRLRGMPT